MWEVGEAGREEDKSGPASKLEEVCREFLLYLFLGMDTGESLTGSPELERSIDELLALSVSGE